MLMQLLRAALVLVASLPLAAAESEWRLAMDRAESARQMGKVQDALRAYEEAFAASGASGDLRFEQAVARGRRASLLHDLQRSQQAEKGYRDALALLKVQPASEASEKYAVTLTVDLAALYLELEQPSKAVKLGIEKMIPAIENAEGSGRAYSILGALAFVQRRYPEAEAWWLKALAAEESAQSNESAAVLLSNLGLLSLANRNVAASVRYHRRSIEQFTILYGLEHPRTTKAQANFAQALLEAGSHEEALAYIERAHGIARQWYGEENVTTAHLCIQHAESLSRAGRKQEAKVLFQRVRALPASIKSALVGTSSVDVLTTAARPRAVR
ncbi:MAG TPA: tetratricopeptide repeat protein [Bryobacteraceae bacterium]|nr:tetratricopeptide repeat protein [Bryobacteraceae bacterium]